MLSRVLTIHLGIQYLTRILALSQASTENSQSNYSWLNSSTQSLGLSPSLSVCVWDCVEFPFDIFSYFVVSHIYVSMFSRMVCSPLHSTYDNHYQHSETRLSDDFSEFSRSLRDLYSHQGKKIEKYGTITFIVHVSVKVRPV